MIKHGSAEKQALSSEFASRGIANPEGLAETVEASLVEVFRGDPPLTVDALRDIHAAKLRAPAGEGARTRSPRP